MTSQRTKHLALSWLESSSDLEQLRRISSALSHCSTSLRARNAAVLAMHSPPTSTSSPSPRETSRHSSVLPARDSRKWVARAVAALVIVAGLVAVCFAGCGTF